MKTVNEKSKRMVEKTKVTTKNTVTQNVVDHRPENWVTRYWRPLMAWQYMAVCLYDFMVAPTLLGIYSVHGGVPYVAWTPLTLQGGGLYHLAMGAVLGITSWSRGQEKIKELTGGS